MTDPGALSLVLDPCREEWAAPQEPVIGLNTSFIPYVQLQAQQSSSGSG